jgi:PAS domain S-box-containing protein
MSFRLKTILGVALIEAVLLVILVSEALSFLYETNANNLYASAHSTARQFSLTIQDAVISDDLASIASFADGLYEAEDVEYCRILSPSREVLAEAGSPEILAIPFREERSIDEVTDGVLDVEMFIEVYGTRFGSIQLGFSTKSLDGVMETSRREMILIALAEMVLVALFSLFLGTYLTRQLQALRDGAQRLSDGALGLTIPVSGNDELAETARSFNKMSTDLLHAEKGLVEQTQLFQDLVQTSSDWFWTTDTEGCIQTLSSGFYASVRAPSEEIIGRLWSDVIESASAGTEQVALVKRLRQAQQQQEPFRDVIYKWKDNVGVERWINLSGKPARDGSGNYVGFRGTGKDVTEAVVREQQLTQANELARESVRSKDRFLATMSHELRTPLNAVLGLSELLKDAKLSETERTYLESVELSGKELLNIVSEILEVARLEDEHVQLAEEPFDFVELIEQTMRAFKTVKGTPDCALQYDVQPKESTRLLGDVGRLRRIMNNLLGNAAKFCNYGTVRVEARLRSMSAGDRMLFCFDVTDTGVGISAEDINRVFEPFFQADDSASRKFGGAGLGLTIVRRLVNAMGGQCHIESQLGQGTHVWFTIPLALAPDEAVTPKDDVLQTDRAGRDEQSALRVLIAEDNAMNLLLVQKMVEKIDAQVEVATNGKEAIDAVRAGDFDVVLMDVQMPEMDGIEATKYIREHVEKARNLPIIAVTANAMDGDREKYFAAGMNGYVSKPINRQKLLGEIDRLVSL